MYKLIKDEHGADRSDFILRENADGSTSWIPNSNLNRDWLAYQAWLDADPANQPDASE